MFDLDKLDELEKAASKPWGFAEYKRNGDDSLALSIEGCGPRHVHGDHLATLHCDDMALAVALRNAYPAMSQELRKLRETVAKLPKTADGVPVTPEMKLYRMMDHAAPNPYGITDWKVRESVAQMIPWRTEVTFYSTREAAEAAKK
jgi:hypothetical protein